MTDSLHDFIDENGLSTDDVIDRLNIDVPDEPSDFYDSEPSVDDLVEDFDAVDALADSKESLESEVTELNNELRSYKTEEFEDKAERLAELTSRDKESLVESFEDGEITVEEINDKISVAEDAVESTTTMPDGESKNKTKTHNDNQREINTTDGGRYDLRQTTKGGN